VVSPSADSSGLAKEVPARKKMLWIARDGTIFAVILCGVILLHLPLLHLPYIWDEAGYYVPAARDLLVNGSLIPRTTVSNAHPPLLMAWLALCWRFFGQSIVVARLAMLVVATFTLLGIFRLAERIANAAVAIASTVCVALYSVFFMQSSLVHLDLAAAGFTLWGLRSYVSDRPARALLWFSLAGLAKETAVLTPVALVMWELLCVAFSRRGRSVCLYQWNWRRMLLLVGSLGPLILWFAYHFWRTGYLFGNPEFFRYNVSSTMEPVRILLAAGIRIWQLTGYLHLFLLTIATGLAMLLPAQVDANGQRQRIDIAIQFVFATVIATYLVAMSVIGGAELARYLLPVIPLEIILCISTLWRRVPYWKTAVAIIALGFVSAWFVNPPHGFAFEDNLAYRDYILLHRNAAEFLQRHYAKANVLTAWPASDELTRPYLGYVQRPIHVVQIENFSYEQVSSAAQSRVNFNVGLVFSTKYLPPGSLLARWPAWERLQTRYFGFHRDLPPAAAAEVLGGKVIYTAARKGQWIAVIERNEVLDARFPETLNQVRSSQSRSGPHDMTGVSLYDEPNLHSRLQVE